MPRAIERLRASRNNPWHLKAVFPSSSTARSSVRSAPAPPRRRTSADAGRALRLARQPALRTGPPPAPAATVGAQQRAPPAATPPAYYGVPITNEQAKAVAAAAFS